MTSAWGRGGEAHGGGAGGAGVGYSQETLSVIRGGAGAAGGALGRRGAAGARKPDIFDLGL